MKKILLFLTLFSPTFAFGKYAKLETPSDDILVIFDDEEMELINIPGAHTDLVPKDLFKLLLSIDSSSDFKQKVKRLSKHFKNHPSINAYLVKPNNRYWEFIFDYESIQNREPLFN